MFIPMYWFLLKLVDESCSSLEALPVDDGGTGLVVLLLGDPHGLEGGEGSQDGASDPDGVLPLWWSDDLDLHGVGGSTSPASTSSIVVGSVPSPQTTTPASVVSSPALVVPPIATRPPVSKHVPQHPSKPGSRPESTTTTSGSSGSTLSSSTTVCSAALVVILIRSIPSSVSTCPSRISPPSTTHSSTSCGPGPVFPVFHAGRVHTGFVNCINDNSNNS